MSCQPAFLVFTRRSPLLYNSAVMKIKSKPDVEKENEFLSRVPAVIGLTGEGTSFPSTHIGRHPAPSKPIKVDEEAAQNAHVRIHEGSIIWTREQSRLIEYLARFTTENKTPDQSVSTKHKAPGANLHIKTLFRFGNKMGITRPQIAALRKFKPFWEAINERKKEILGVERFSAVADAIYNSAINGSHSDRKLYLDVFCDHVKTKDPDKEPSSFERLLMQELQRKRRLKKKKPKTIVLKKRKRKRDTDTSEYI